jgi:hypothetical protein
MFTALPKTPYDYFKITRDMLAALPKTQLDVKNTFEKVHTVFQAEAANSHKMWKTYEKSFTGDASINDIAAANKQAEQLMKATGFAFLIAMPGTIFVLPAIIAAANSQGFDIVPETVKREFKL